MSADSKFFDFRYEESLAPPPEHTFASVGKRTLEITDTNSFNYTAGQITFDLNALVNNKDFFDPKASTFNIPVTLFAKIDHAEAVWNNTEDALVFLRDSFGLKNYFTSLISGMTIMCNGQTLETAQPMQNIPMTWRLMKTQNTTDARLRGPAAGGWLPDDGDDFDDRGENYVYHPAVGAVDAAPIDSRRTRLRAITPLRTSESGGRLLYDGERNTTRRVNTCGFSSDRKTFMIEYVCTIPMAQTHDLWEQMKLQRGAFWQLVIHTHMPTTFVRKIRTAGAGSTSIFWNDTGKVVSPFQFCPFSMAYEPHTRSTGTNSVSDNADNLRAQGPLDDSEDANYGAADLGAAYHETTNPYACRNRGGPLMVRIGGANFTANAFGTVTFGCDIGHGAGLSQGMSLGAGYQVSPAMKQCTLQAQQWDIAQAYALKLVGSHTPTSWHSSLVCRPDNLRRVEPGADVVANLTAGQAYMDYLLIVPYLAGADHIAQPNSPFSDWGGAGSYAPYVHLNDLQIRVSGRPLFDKPLQSKYMQWFQEQEGVEAVNGNALVGLRQGLLTWEGFNAHQTAICINMKHHQEGSYSIPSSVDIEFRNDTKQRIGVMCFIVYQKMASFNPVSGEVKPVPGR